MASCYALVATMTVLSVCICPSSFPQHLLDEVQPFSMDALGYFWKFLASGTVPLPFSLGVSWMLSERFLEVGRVQSGCFLSVARDCSPAVWKCSHSGCLINPH